jgi:hypothetical protein
LGTSATPGNAYIEGVDSLVHNQFIAYVTGYFFPGQHQPGTYTIVGHLSAGNYCPDSDTLEVTIHVPEVYLDLPEILDLSSPAIDLFGGSPGPGTYAFVGEAGTITQFHPASAGVGYHQIIYSYTDPLTGCSGTAIDSIYVVLHVGLNEPAITDGSRLFPNPAQDEVTIDFNDRTSGQLLIHDGSGRVVLSLDVKATPLRVDISALPAGAYLLTLDQHGEKFRRVLVKE